MKIGKPDEGSLLIALTEALQSGNVTYYGYIQLPSDWENAFKASLDSEFSKRLYSHLDDGGLSSLLQREIFLKFYELNLELPEKDSTKKLTSYKPFSDPLKTARMLVEVIRSLPRQYEIVARAVNALSDALQHPIEPLRIFDRMHLVSGSSLSGRFKLSSGNNNIDGLLRAYGSRDANLLKIEDNALYLVYRTSGYISDRESTRVFSDFNDDIRAFYGASISFGIFHNFSTNKYSSASSLIANEIISDNQSYSYCEASEKDIADSIGLYKTKNTDGALSKGSPPPGYIPRCNQAI